MVTGEGSGRHTGGGPYWPCAHQLQVQSPVGRRRSWRLTRSGTAYRSRPEQMPNRPGLHRRPAWCEQRSPLATLLNQLAGLKLGTGLHQQVGDPQARRSGAELSCSHGKARTSRVNAWCVRQLKLLGRSLPVPGPARVAPRQLVVLPSRPGRSSPAHLRNGRLCHPACRVAGLVAETRPGTGGAAARGRLRRCAPRAAALGLSCPSQSRPGQWPNLRQGRYQCAASGWRGMRRPGSRPGSAGAVGASWRPLAFRAW